MALLHKVVEAGNKLVEPHLVVMSRHITSLASRPVAEVNAWLSKLVLVGKGDEAETESEAIANLNQLKSFITAIVEEDW